MYITPLGVDRPFPNRQDTSIIIQIYLFEQYRHYIGHIHDTSRQLDGYQLYILNTQQPYTLNLTRIIRISATLKRYIHTAFISMSQYINSCGRLHIKVVGCIYSDSSHMNTGGISLGLTDLIGYHFIWSKVASSIFSLYPYLSRSSRYNLFEWSFYRDSCWRSILVGIS